MLTFVFVLYNLLMIPVILLLFPYFLIRALFTGKDRHGIFQRIGLIPGKIFKTSGYVWFHTVSAGEVKAAVPVMEKFIGKEDVAVSVGTYTGYRMVKEHFGDNVTLFYMPVDFIFFLMRLFNLMGPKALVIVETEIWPQLVRLSSLKKIPLLLINGRIPPKDYRGYRIMRFFWKHIFKMYTAFLVQSQVEKNRFVQCGADSRAVEVLGNTKYDVYSGDEEADDRTERLDKIFSGAKGRRIMVVGSTHRGEEEILFSRFGKAVRDFALILAPRHPDRIEEVEEILDKLGYSHERRSGNVTWKKDVLVWDTMGELDLVYKYAHVVLVGGSWIPQGGHNIIEPAVWGKPVVVGPHMHNFTEIYEIFADENAIVTLKEEDISNRLDAIVSDDKLLRELGRNSLKCVQLNAGAADKYVSRIEKAIL